MLPAECYWIYDKNCITDCWVIGGIRCDFELNYFSSITKHRRKFLTRSQCLENPSEFDDRPLPLELSNPGPRLQTHSHKQSRYWYEQAPILDLRLLHIPDLASERLPGSWFVAHLPRRESLFGCKAQAHFSFHCAIAGELPRLNLLAIPAQPSLILRW